MRRLGAALLAGIISVLLFASAIGLVDAVLGSKVLWHTIGSRGVGSHGFFGWGIVLNCFVMPFGFWFFWLIYSERRPAKDEPLPQLTPLIRRSPVTGQREL